jgi:hypothetical protein
VGLLTTIIILEVVSFHAFVPFPELLSFLNASSKLDSVRVFNQHCLRFYVCYLNCVKMAAFHFYLQSGKQRKEDRVRDDTQVVSDQKIHC